MKSKHLYSAAGLLLLMNCAPQAIAADTVQSAASFRMTMPTTGEMNMMSDDPLVQEMIRRQHAYQQAQQNRHDNVHRGRDKKAKKSGNDSAEPEIIKLEVPENLPEVVNRSKSFIFTDITDRSDNQVSQQLDSAKRINQIEMLRRSAITQQD